MIHRICSITLASCLALPLAACGATAPTPQLVDARQAYNDAASGPAAQVAPKYLLDAKQALDRAEAAHGDEPGSHEEAHFGYIAERKAQIARAQADIALGRQARANAEQGYGETQDELRTRAEQNLDQTRENLEQTQDRLQDQQATTDRTQQELAAERTARLEAEKAAMSAIASLKEVAQVKEEANRTVITLSGSVLFKTNDASLLPVAKTTLAKVAQALKDQTDDKNIVVQGHTDSRGAEQHNQQLSTDRAESVLRYLVDQGVNRDRIRAVGKGEIEPIGDNSTPDGRANNRRVEIVIEGGQT